MFWYLDISWCFSICVSGAHATSVSVQRQQACIDNRGCSLAALVLAFAYYIVQISIIHVDECIYILYILLLYIIIIYYYYDGCYCYLCLLFLLLLFFLYIWLCVIYTRYSIMYLCLTCIGVLKFEMLTCLHIYSDIYICYTIKYATADNLCYIHRLYTYIPHGWICMQYNNIPNKAISCITS